MTKTGLVAAPYPPVGPCACGPWRILRPPCPSFPPKPAHSRPVAPDPPNPACSKAPSPAWWLKWSIGSRLGSGNFPGLPYLSPAEMARLLLNHLKAASLRLPILKHLGFWLNTSMKSTVRTLFLFAGLLLGQGLLFGQSGGVSPYSIYGHGWVQPNAFTYHSILGGTQAAATSGLYVNPAQPAS